MSAAAPGTAAAIESIYRSDSRVVLATLVRLLGDLDLAEEAVQDAFLAAAEQWPRDGLPVNPRAWLVSAGRFKAIDRLRRRARFDAALGTLAERLGDPMTEPTRDADTVDDDLLRLIFTCCHPALPPDAQVAMTLREVCGLTTEEIARACLASPPTIAQRIVRAKAKIKADRIAYEVPRRPDLERRLEPVLRVVYLVFAEGYSASRGPSVTRMDLSDEAIRLGRLLVELVPEPEAVGLLSLMLLHHARRHTRASEAGDLVLLADQDRSRWDRPLIDEGLTLLDRAHAAGRPGPYVLQAAIAAVHARALTPEETDWPRIVELYDILAVADPSPVVELNRAVAVAMRDGPGPGLDLVDGILGRGDLAGHHLAHATRADLLRRLGRRIEARAAYRRALDLAGQEPERRFLERRLRELDVPERAGADPPAATPRADGSST